MDWVEAMAYFSHGLGRLHLALGEPEQAIDSFQNVLALAPAHTHSTAFDRCPLEAYALSGLEEAFR